MTIPGPGGLVELSIAWHRYLLSSSSLRCKSLITSHCAAENESDVGLQLSLARHHTSLGSELRRSGISVIWRIVGLQPPWWGEVRQSVSFTCQYSVRPQRYKNSAGGRGGRGERESGQKLEPRSGAGVPCADITITMPDFFPFFPHKSIGKGFTIDRLSFFYIVYSIHIQVRVSVRVRRKIKYANIFYY